LSGLPLLVAEAIEAGGPLGSLPALTGDLILGLLLERAGIEGQQPAAPAVFAGPILDGRQALDECVGDSFKGARMAKLEESRESAESARGLAGAAGKGQGGGLRLEAGGGVGWELRVDD
jgi:hypothetical protein